MDFHEADRQLHHKGHGGAMHRRRIQRNTYLVRKSDDEIALLLHHTYIARFFRDGSVILDSGGWRTMTTKDRLDHVSGWVVFSGRHHARAESHWWLLPTRPRWWLDRDKKEQWVPFFDGIHLHQHAGEVLSSDEELEWVMNERDPGPSKREKITDYITMLLDPEEAASRLNSTQSIINNGTPPQAIHRAIVEGRHFGIDVLFKAIELDAAKRGELDREIEREALEWAEMLAEGKEPRRFRSTVRNFITYLESA